MAGGPDRPGWPSGGNFSAFSQMGSKMASKNGVKKWGPKWDQKWGPKMGSKMGSKMGQLPSLRAATTTNKNEKSPLSVSSGSGWGPLGGGEGEGGKLKAAVRSHSLVAPRGGWRISISASSTCPTCRCALTSDVHMKEHACTVCTCVTEALTLTCSGLSDALFGATVPITNGSNGASALAASPP